MERMSWLSKLHPRAVGHRASRSASLQSPVTADPETCLMVFKNHWCQVLRILEQRGPRGPGAADDLSAVRNNSYQMLTLLAEERAGAGAGAGPILQLVLAENLLERLLQWHLQREGSEEQRAEQLKLYEMLISQSRQPLLRHPPVRGPLLRLLSLCAEPASPALRASLVLLLNQLCGCLAKDPALLELFFHRPAEQGPADLLPFSLLVPFVHHEGPTGQQARDALLLLLAMAASNRAVATYITDSSYFCPVLATGLSALYSSLPRKIEVRADDWHSLRREDWMGVPALVLFMNSLEFCNAVLQVAHPLVQKQLVNYVHNGFLVPVLGPALHKTAVEELMASTAYLELFLRSVSDPALLQTFLRFILLHRHDHSTILDTLVARIAANSRLCMVSLSLFRTLLNLNCEDVMLQLVLRYLIPCSHVMLSQKRAVKDLDIYGKSADKFLSLIPRCCRAESLPAPDREEEHATWAKAHGSPTVDTSSVVTVPKPSTPSRLAFFMRQQSCSSEAGSPAPRSPGLATPGGSPCHRPARWEEVAELDGNYLEYLRDAQLGVEQCVRACRVWSAPYDGERPSAASLAPSQPAGPPGPATPRTKKRGLAEEGVGLAGAPSSSEPSAGHSTPDVEDSAPLLNGAPGVESSRAGRPAGAVAVKKVRRGPPSASSERQRRGLKAEAENGSPTAPAPAPAWEQLSVDSLIDELLARAPSEPNGASLSIESFSRELRELEAELQSGAEQPPTSPAEPLSQEEEEEAYERFASPPERPAPAASGGAPGPLAQLVSSPLCALGQPPSQPFTGPFVAVLLAKLENMVQNSLYVNVLVTGLVARLACYPQPLLRSFLLNTNMVFQPSVKSLLQVLGSVKNKIESFAARQEDFPTLLFKARKYLLARGQLDWADAPNAAPALRRSETLVKSRKPSIGELILRHANSPTRARQAAQLALQQVREAPVGTEKQNEALRVRNAVYSAVIFSEFLKELAAIAQAHGVTSPFLLEPEE
ncbi:unnamed protein product [Natator depressus]|uniref:FHF complex subunit HOOK-interacting protein 1B n=1 Tax=Natator depressus TaxID=27790 RepID=UPI003D4EEDB8